MDKTKVLEKPKEEVVEELVQPAVATPVIPQEEEKPNILKRFWYLFVIFGVMIVLSLGILVYGYHKLSQAKPVPLPTPTPIPTPTVAEEVDEQTSALKGQGSSDELEDIETDLEATDLSGIDQELEDIDSEFSSP